MTNDNQDFSPREEQQEQGEDIQRLLYRIIPYIPLLVAAILLGMVGARIYLRYQVPVYVARARVVVNDETQQKSTNLQEIMQIDTRNLSAETEREMQILRSRDLLRKLAVKMQLNVKYSQKGRIRTAHFYDKLPFRLLLENPDSVKKAFSSEVVLTGNQVQFNGQVFPLDSLVATPVGNLKWVRNPDYKNELAHNKIEVTVVPVVAAVNELQNSLFIEPISKSSSILDLTYTDPIPSRAVDILNSLISIYGSSGVDYKSRIYDNTQRFLDGRLRLVSDELNGVEQNMETYKTTEGIVDLDDQGKLLLDKFKENDIQISQLDAQLDILKQNEQYVLNRNKTNNPVPATLGLTDMVLNNLLAQLYQTEFDLEKVKQVSGEKNPQIGVYEEMLAKLRPSILSSINNLKQNIAGSRQRLLADNNALLGSLGKLPKKERLLLDISRQQGIKNAIYTFLLQKKEESAIAAASIVPNYRVIEQPEPAGQISPVPEKYYLTGILAALVIAVLFVYFREFYNKRLLFRQQIEELVPLPVIAELIFEPHEQNNPIVVGDGKRTLIAEQFRELRTNINYILGLAKDKCKVILITSSIPKEGKSFVAINAAISLCLTGDKVVLLEFDLRKPKISKPLGISSDPGLSNFLIGKASAPEIVKPHSSIPNLFVIPSGPIPPNPAELLSSPKLQELVTYLKQHYDFVLVDSPPVAAVTDAKILASISDSTIYIVRHNYTSYSFLNLINDIHRKNGLPNINIVFNGIINKKILGYGYGKGYGYGYGYGYTQETKKISFWKRIFSSSRR
jgi:capsular exopolysaccharide synthesis family protein